MLNDIPCSNCGSAALRVGADGRVACERCGAEHAPPRSVCAACGQVNADGARFCSGCGEGLTYACRVCGADNWSGAEACANCGRRLDLLEAVGQGMTDGLRRRLEEQRAGVNALKQEEERASQARLAKLWAADNERRERLAEAAARQAAQDKRALQGAFLGAALLLVFAAAVFLIMLLRW